MVLKQKFSDLTWIRFVFVVFVRPPYLPVIKDRPSIVRRRRPSRNPETRSASGDTGDTDG